MGHDLSQGPSAPGPPAPSSCIWESGKDSHRSLQNRDVQFAEEAAGGRSSLCRYGIHSSEKCVPDALGGAGAGREWSDSSAPEVGLWRASYVGPQSWPRSEKGQDKSQIINGID